MPDRQEKLGIVVYVQDEATGKLSKVKAEIAGMGSAGTTAGRGLSTGVTSIEKSAGRISGAFSHAKSAIGGLLTGPLGILGLGAGLFSLTTFFDSSLHKASDFAVQIEKLTGLTGESAQSMGALILLADKYGISEERLGMIVGFTEKTLGKLNQTTSKTAAAGKSAELVNLEHIRNERVAAGLETQKIDLLIREQKARDALNTTDSRAVAGESKLVALDKQYGVSLVDKSGKVKNFSGVLSTLADYYTSNATAESKAALTAQIFGRGYADLIPILRLGSKGIAEQEQAYKDLGLQLGTNTQDTLKAYQASIRQVGEAVDILQLQLGLALAPMITEVADRITLFLEHGGAKGIVAVFEDGAHFAEALGHAIGTYVIPAFSAIKGGWDALPEPLRNVLLAGQIGGKASKFLFGVDLSPTHLVGNVAKGVLGGFGNIFGQILGKTPLGKVLGGLGVPHVWVDNLGPGGMGGAGGIPGAAGGIGLKTLLGGLGITAIAAAPVAAVYEHVQNDVVGPQLDAEAANAKTALTHAKSLAELQQQRAVIQSGIDSINNGITGGHDPVADALARVVNFGAMDQFKSQLADIDKAIVLLAGAKPTAAGSAADLRESNNIARIAGLTLAVNKNTAAFEKADWLKKLESSWQKAGQTMHDKIAAAMADLAAGKNVHAAAGFIGSKLGNAGFGAGGYDTALKAIAQLKSLKTNDPAVVSAIHELTARLPRLKVDKADLAAAVKEANSNDPKNVKLDKLAAIARDAALHGDRTTHTKIEGVIAEVKRKKLSTTVNIHDVTTVRLSTSMVDANGRLHTAPPELVVAQRSYKDQRNFAAKGGPLDPRVPTVVGEEGPELIVDGYVYDARKTASMLQGRGGSRSSAPSHPEHGLARAVAVTVNNRISPVGLHRATTTHRIYNAGAGEAISV